MFDVSLLGYHIRTMSVEHHNVHTIVIIMSCSLAPNVAVFLPMPLVNAHLGKGLWDGLQHVPDCKQCRCHNLGMVVRVNVKMLIVGSGQCYNPSRCMEYSYVNVESGSQSYSLGVALMRQRKKNKKRLCLYSPFPRNILLACEPLVSFAHFGCT